MSRLDALDVLAWLNEAGVDTIVSEQPGSWLRIEECPPPPASSQEIAPEKSRSSGHLPEVPRASPAASPLIEGAGGSGLTLILDMDPRLGGDGILADQEALLLSRMMAAIGIRYDEVIRIGAPNGVNPEALRESLAAGAETRILLIGDGPSKALLGVAAAQARGKVHQLAIGDRQVPLVATFAPEFLIRQPRMKALAWADLQLLAAVASNQDPQSGRA